MKYNQRSRRIRSYLFFFIVVVLVSLWSVIPVSLSAAQSEFPQSVKIDASQVINDDFYQAAETITIDGTIQGDAVLAAKHIIINGTIAGDLIAIAQAIDLNGNVNDDVLIVGQALRLGKSAQVKDDAMAAGWSLEQQMGSTIGGNLHFVSRQGLLAGTVQRNLGAAVGALEVGGKVAGNLRLLVSNEEPSLPPFMPDPPFTIPQVPSGLTLTDTAQIGGKLAYRSDTAAKISPKAQVAGGITHQSLDFHEQRHRDRDIHPTLNWGTILLDRLQYLVALGLVGWLLLRFVPDWTQQLATTIQTQPLPSLGWGVVGILAIGTTAMAIPFAIILLTLLLLITLPILAPPVLGIGLVFHLALVTVSGIFFIFIPPILVSFIGGKWLWQKIRPEAATNNLEPLFIGLLGFVLLTAIPSLGLLLSLLTIAGGLGAFWLWWQTLRLDRGLIQKL